MLCSFLKKDTFGRTVPRYLMGRETAGTVAEAEAAHEGQYETEGYIEPAYAACATGSPHLPLTATETTTTITRHSSVLLKHITSSR
jgi:hypothetical protein